MMLRRIGFVLAMLGLTSLALSPAQVKAGPVEMNQVRQVLKGNYQRGGANAGIELRLQDDDKKKAPGKAQDPNNPGGRPAQEGRPPQEPVEEVTVETCNCEPNLPDIPVAGGGFPKWLFGLAAIPLICLTGICTSDNNPPPITPPGPDATPTPPGPGPSPTPPIPEPATILLLGSGLLALGGAARRYRRKPADEENQEGK